MAAPCPHCGAEVLPGNAFCHRCRRRLRAVGEQTLVIAGAALEVVRRPRWPRALLAACALAALVAATLILPARWRSRVEAREAAAVRDLRTVLTAERRYSQSNAGFYDRLECLTAPARCVPGYPAASRPFLDAAAFGQSRRGGYEYVFHPGPAPAAGTFDPSRVSPSSVAAFAYVAVGERSRIGAPRTFCADSTGRVCVPASPDAPELRDGLCPLACLDLR